MKQTIKGNIDFMKKTILPMTKDAGIMKVKITIIKPQLPDDKVGMEITFDTDKEKNAKLLALLKKKVGQKRSPKRKKMNLTVSKEQIKEIIKEELYSFNESKVKDYGFKSDVEKFKQEYDTHQGEFKQKALSLRERQQTMKAVGVVNKKIMEMLSELNKLPVSDALENVNKSSVKKYISALETLKGICEQNAGWIEENK
mgnify:FL=1|tara:strand:+ start:550 stop:1146 length:597 start_codon:yes stop_codon:yes gene_type:complete